MKLEKEKMKGGRFKITKQHNEERTWDNSGFEETLSNLNCPIYQILSS